MEKIWCRAVWKEDDQEEEGVIPSVRVKLRKHCHVAKRSKCPESNERNEASR